MQDVQPIQILIADDSAPFRAGLRALLKATPQVSLVGEATDGAEVIALAEQLQPDVILMDLQMPRLNGVEATRQLVSTSPHIAVLVITMFDDDDSVLAVLQAGARGYLLKGARKEEIVRAIHNVVNGEAVFGPAIAKRMLQFFVQMSTRTNLNLLPELTHREREILELMAQYKTNSEIAKQLQLSEKTVRNYASNIFSKLQVADRTQAILRAHDAGLATRLGQQGPSSGDL